MAEKDYTAQLSAGKKRAVGLKVFCRDRRPLAIRPIRASGAALTSSRSGRAAISIAVESASFHFKMQKAN